MTSGDEPHYLLILNSILRDGDLQLEADYRRVAAGGGDAGMRFRGVHLDHHTILVDRESGAHALWSQVYWPNRRARGPVGFVKKLHGFDGPEVVEVPAHPPAFPALLALLVALARPALEETETAARAAVVFISWLGLVAAYGAGRGAGFSRAQALGAVLLAGFCSPWLAYSRSYFAETAVGLFLSLALWAMTVARPALGQQRERDSQDGGADHHALL